MKKIKTILLDLDGVIVQLVPALCELFCLKFDDYLKNCTPGDYSLGNTFGKIWDITPDAATKRLWSRVSQLGSAFWADLELYPWGKELMLACFNRADTVICTAPTLNPTTSKGKVTWMRKHITRDFKNFALTTRKELLARPDALLIDDHDDNVEKFRAEGGNAILFPRLWNAGYARDCDWGSVIEEMGGYEYVSR